MNKLYLVLTTEVFAGDEQCFFTDEKLFTMRKDAEDYFNEQDPFSDGFKAEYATDAITFYANYYDQL